jgi:site-specific recombinase XerD
VNTVQADSELYPNRRHLRACEFFGPGGREVRADKCKCPFHVDGLHNGRRIRESLKTRSRQLADRRLADLKRKLDAEFASEHGLDHASGPTPAATTLTISEAVARFLKTYGEIGPDGKYRGDSEHGTWKKYRCTLRFLMVFCETAGIRLVADVTTDALEDFRGTRMLGKVSWKVERQMLITFFRFCIRRKWCSEDPAKELKSPRNLKPNEVVPYTLQEESQILSACDQIGGGRYNRSGARYEQLRARAMIVLLRHTALRISDVCTLRKDAVSWDPEKNTWRIFLYTQKTGDQVLLPIPESVKLVLDGLPLPRNAGKECPYYFWNSVSSRRAVVGIAERTLSAVFKKSGVKDAHAHRYRHTLATRLLEQGATFEQVADVLGNSPEVVRRHYGKWSKGRQANIDRLMMAHFQTAAVTNPVTRQSHEKMGAVN